MSASSSILTALLSYPVMAITALTAAVSLLALFLKGKMLKKTIKIFFILLALLSAALIAFYVYLLFAFGHSHPIATPAPFR